MSRSPRRTLTRPVQAALLALATLGAQGSTQAARLPLADLHVAGATSAAATPAPATLAEATAQPAPPRSAMDRRLFKEVLTAEMHANQGRTKQAHSIYLQVAQRVKDEDLYQRSVEVAWRGRALELALASTKRWSKDFPRSRLAREFAVQTLIALDRPAELLAPMQALVNQSNMKDQPAIIIALSRGLARLSNKKAAAELVDSISLSWRTPPTELAEMWLTSASGWQQAQDGPRAMTALQKAAFLKPGLPQVGLLAVDLMPLSPQAEDLVKQQLSQTPPSPTLQLAYGRRLAASRRYTESAEQLDTFLKAQPDQTGSWLTLAAVRMELKQWDQAEAALQHVLARQSAAAPSQQAPDLAMAPDQANNPANTTQQAYLLMSQIAEQRQQLPDAIAWLEKADPGRERLQVQGQHARLLVQQGRLADARQLIRGLPESEPRDAVTKYQAEAQLLRDAQQWEEAFKVLGEASARFPQDNDLLYDQAMLADKLDKFGDMERLLKRVITSDPKNHNALNALGYSLADRGERLPEARTLIKKALALKPDDPLITDSLGWVNYKLGKLVEAERLLRLAFKGRADAEIAAHLSEVLWFQGKHDEARAIMRQALDIDANNDAVKDFLLRVPAIKP